MSGIPKAERCAYVFSWGDRCGDSVGARVHWDDHALGGLGLFHHYMAPDVDRADERVISTNKLRMEVSRRDRALFQLVKLEGAHLVWAAKTAISPRDRRLAAALIRDIVELNGDLVPIEIANECARIGYEIKPRRGK